MARADDAVNRPEQTTPDVPDAHPRLDGDALYWWAKMIAEMEFAQKSLTSFGKEQMRKRGLDPDAYLIDNEGFIKELPEHPRIEDFLKKRPG